MAPDLVCGLGPGRPGASGLPPLDRPAAAPDPWLAAPTPAPGDERPAPDSRPEAPLAPGVTPGPIGLAGGPEAPPPPTSLLPPTSPSPSSPSRTGSSPLPPAAHPGPSVASPAAAPRRVLMPDPAERSPERPPEPIPIPVPPKPMGARPRNGADSRSGPARPVFIDPPAPSYLPGSEGSAPPRLPGSVYEQTIAPGVGLSPGPGQEKAGGGLGSQSTWSPLLVAALAFAMLVVVAALLLTFGVL